MTTADDLRRYVLNIEADAWALRWTEPATCRRLSHEAHECLGLLDQLAAENAALRAENTVLRSQPVFDVTVSDTSTPHFYQAWCRCASCLAESARRYPAALAT